MVQISVIIPTIRDTTLNEKCLANQTFKDFEAIIQRPTRPLPKGNFYQLNHDMNQAIKKSKGELIISYQDGISIRPDCLERFWEHYKDNPKIIIGAVGDQYSSMEPPVKVWTDPRKKTEFGSFYECMPDDIEFTLCAIPRSALIEAGGLDADVYDKYAAIAEKELCARIDKLGYKFYLDQSLEYMALAHPRIAGKEEWDKHYFAGWPIYQKHLEEIKNGTRLKLNYL